MKISSSNFSSDAYKVSLILVSSMLYTYLPQKSVATTSIGYVIVGINVDQIYAQAQKIK